MTAKIGRPKSENPKNRRVSIKLTESEFQNLEEVAEQTGKTKTEILMLGLEKVYNEIKK